MRDINVTGNSNTVEGDKIKKNTKITVSIGSVVIIVAVLFVFVHNSNSIEKKIVGTWQLSGTEGLFEFTKDGKFIYLSGSNGGVTMTYTIDEDRLQLNLSVLWADSTIFADVDISGKTMTLTNFISPDNLVKEEKLEFIRAE